MKEGWVYCTVYFLLPELVSEGIFVLFLVDEEGLSPEGTPADQ